MAASQGPRPGPGRAARAATLRRHDPGHHRGRGPAPADARLHPPGTGRGRLGWVARGHGRRGPPHVRPVGDGAGRGSGHLRLRRPMGPRRRALLRPLRARSPGRRAAAALALPRRRDGLAGRPGHPAGARDGGGQARRLAHHLAGRRDGRLGGRRARGRLARGLRAALHPLPPGLLPGWQLGLRPGHAATGAALPVRLLADRGGRPGRARPGAWFRDLVARPPALPIGVACGSGARMRTRRWRRGRRTARLVACPPTRC